MALLPAVWQQNDHDRLKQDAQVHDMRKNFLQTLHLSENESGIAAVWCRERTVARVARAGTSRARSL